MSAPEPTINPDLDAQLDVTRAALSTAQADVAGRFVIDDLEKASWAVRKIAHERARLAEERAVYDAERASLDAWIDARTVTCDQATSYLEGLLRRFHEERLADEGADPATATKEQWAKAASKTIKLPAGALVARRGPDSLDIDDDQFIPWAEAVGQDDLVQVRKSPKKAEIKAHVGEVMSDGRVVHEATGEFMPGVTWVDGTVHFSVKTEEAAR